MPLPKNQLKKFGKYLRDTRKQQKMTQEELMVRLQARGFTYSEATISVWESGGRYPLLLACNENNEMLVHVLADIFKTTEADILFFAGALSATGDLSAAAWHVAINLDKVDIKHRVFFVDILEGYLSIAKQFGPLPKAEVETPAVPDQTDSSDS